METSTADKEGEKAGKVETSPAPAEIDKSNIPPGVPDLPKFDAKNQSDLPEVPRVKTVSSASVEQVVNDQFAALSMEKTEKVFGNKSRQELQSIQDKNSHLSAGILFTDASLRIPPAILDALTIDMRFEKPSEIQASTIPLILSNESVIAQAQSGAGKTIAFVIGMLAKVDPRLPQLQALCLTPTRELAIQILSLAVRPLSARIPGITFEEALPGRDIAPGRVCRSQIVVGTPGTVKRWMLGPEPYLNLSGVRIFVVDEADKMVEDKSLGLTTMEIKKKLNPERCQILFFSATYSDQILKYARGIVPRAYVVKPKSTEELVLDVIFQIRMDVNTCQGGKLQVLKDIYSFLTIQQSIVFVERREYANQIAAMMIDEGFDVSNLHGGLPEYERDQVMANFRNGQSKVLITTNALARGVDVPAVAVVVNYDLPVKYETKRGKKVISPDEETYLHRIGRCGRFGRRGTAINFLQKPEDFEILEHIERHFSPEKPMTTAWDATDIVGLSDAIKDRPEGGEILPAAESTSDGVQSTVSISKIG